MPQKNLRDCKSKSCNMRHPKSWKYYKLHQTFKFEEHSFYSHVISTEQSGINLLVAHINQMKNTINTMSGKMKRLSATRGPSATKNLKKYLFAEKIRKRCFPLKFPILGICNSTRALQFSQFQNTGVVWAWRSPGERWTKICVCNIGLCAPPPPLRPAT